MGPKNSNSGEKEGHDAIKIAYLYMNGWYLVGLVPYPAGRGFPPPRLLGRQIRWPACPFFADFRPSEVGVIGSFDQQPAPE